MKRLLLVAAALFVVAALGIALLARHVLTGANVHAAIESQLSEALGQPVTIGSIGASIYPRVTMDLTTVSIGKPARIQLAAVHVGTGLRALLSRRIEHADVRVDGARVTLPLPSFGSTGTSATPTGDGKPPVEIMSIDEIVLKNVEVVSGERTLRGDIELVPHGEGVQIRRIALAADTTTIAMTGDLTAIAPLTGQVDVTADTLDIDRLIGFVSDFTAASTSAQTAAQTTATASGAPSVSPVGQLSVGLRVGKMMTGTLALSDFAATAVITPDAARFEPLTLGVFGGRYDGSMQLALGDMPKFQWRAKVSGIDTASLMAFAGSPNTITGTLSGTVSLDGEGLQMEQALRTAHGRSRIDIANGTIAGLQLVRTIVTATSGRGGLLASAGAAVVAHDTPGGERFSRLGATLQLAGGVIETSDVSMASTDVDLSASGSLRLAGMDADLAGRAQLSTALSQQAGSDLYLYTQDGGRVTLPVTVTGPIERLSVHVDVGDVAKRAIRNKATDEARKLIERKLPGLSGVGGLFRPKPH
ncbi:MAG: AsmA family protein [Vicinamibacteraceae bacterium]